MSGHADADAARMTSELELAGRVVELVRRVAGAGAEAEVAADRTHLALTRFANSAIHQNVAEERGTVRLRLHVEGRTATGSTTVTSMEGLRGLVERTLAAARVCPPDPGWSGLTPPATVTTAAQWDEATAHASPDDRAERVRAFVAAADGLNTAGYCRTTHHVGAFVNTAGQTVTGRAAEAAMDGIARTVASDGVARLASPRLAELDGAALGRRAAGKARGASAPVELPPGRYEVVLEPAAVADLLQNLAWFGFNGKAYNEGRSFVEPGAGQFDPSVSLVDDAPADPVLPFDAEGTPRRRLVLVEDGVTRQLAHDRRTAAVAGCESTGHAVPGGATAGAILLNLGLLPTGVPTAGHGTSTGTAGSTSGPVVDADAADLVSQVRRGLLVTDLWYTRVLDPKSLVVTGLTRNGVWLVENGEVTTAVRNFRFTQSYPLALGPGAVLGIGRRAVRQPDSWEGAFWSAPALRLASWNFTGGASG